jgi:hypothetical protein
VFGVNDHDSAKPIFDFPGLGAILINTIIEHYNYR